MEASRFQRIAPWLGLGLFLISAWVLHDQLAAFHVSDIKAAWAALPLSNLLWSGLWTFLGYFFLVFYDGLGFLYIRRQMRFGRIAMASFVGYAFIHNVGAAMVSGGSIRYRLYTTWGLSTLEIAQVVAFCAATFWAGFLTLGGVAFLVEPLAIPELLQAPFQTFHPLGVLCLILLVGYITASVTLRKPLKVRAWEFAFPSPKIALGQMAVGAADFLFAALAFWALLPAQAGVTFPMVLGVYLLAQIAGVFSQIPGGLGVFESLMLVCLTPQIPTPTVLEALLAYRIIYFLIPLAFAVILLGVHEASGRKENLKQLARYFGRWVPSLAPPLLAAGTYTAGLVLLLSGALPPIGSRMLWLGDRIPLGVLEVSHLLGSMIGVALLILARGIQLRLDAAYPLTVLALSAGIIFSLLKGLDYEEAILLTGLLWVVVSSRKNFYRKTKFTGQAFTPGWIIAIALALGGSIWLGFFSYKHVEYSQELWWQISLHGNAPRFLRTSAAAVMLALAAALWNLLKPSAPEPTLPSVEELETAAQVSGKSPETYAHLSLLGDKQLLWTEKRDGFLMYRQRGRSFVAMGDPVGPEAAKRELIWRFRELADRHVGWTVYYQIGKAHLPLYVEQGLTLLKIGEQARVPLAEFTLAGKSWAGMRNNLNRLEREGHTFEVYEPAQVPVLFPELKRVSDAWLSLKNVREKGFSLGSYHEYYLSRFPVAVVRRGGHLLAFANLWQGGGLEELSVDLMRHDRDVTNNIMDLLFVKIIQWSQGRGYKWFNLGMAPLSGLEDHRLAPLWNKVLALVYRHGENYYNFRGLRQYKDKFNPVWEPRFLVVPGGLKVPQVLTDISSLISGGIKGLVAK